MQKRFIALSVMVLAGIVSFTATGHMAYAEQATSESRSVSVQPGDYLDKIAADNGTTYLRLFYANEEIKDPDLIYPGEVLRIPDASENLTPRVLPNNVPAYVRAAASAQTNAPQATIPTPASRPSMTVATETGNGTWDRLAACESGGNWSINSGNGFYGGLQFTLSSWQAVGGSGYPNQASREEQISRAQLLQARQGWGAWPACAAKLGLR